MSIVHIVIGILYIVDAMVGLRSDNDIIITAHEVIYEETGRFHPAFSFISWITFPVILILFSTYFVHLVAPNAIGKWHQRRTT